MTTVYLMPIMLLFGFTLMIEFLNFGKDSLTMKIANLFPIPQLIQMDESRAWGPLGIVLIWITAAYCLLIFVLSEQEKFAFLSQLIKLNA